MAKKMTVPEKVESFISEWISHHFSTGCYTGEDYVRFQRKYRTVLRAVAEEAGYKLHKFLGNHYCWSAVLQNQDTGAFAYLSIFDVRWSTEWATNILFRQMKHEKDWTGSQNHFCGLSDLANELKRLYC